MKQCIESEIKVRVCKCRRMPLQSSRVFVISGYSQKAELAGLLVSGSTQSWTQSSASSEKGPQGAAHPWRRPEAFWTGGMHTALHVPSILHLVCRGPSQNSSNCHVYGGGGERSMMLRVYPLVSKLFGLFRFSRLFTQMSSKQGVL